MSTGANPVRSTAPKILVASADPAFRHPYLKSEAGEPEVEEAFSGAHAFAKLRTLDFDTLILDRRLPDLNAHEMAELVRRRFPEVYVSIQDAPPTTPAAKRPETPQAIAIPVPAIPAVPASAGIAPLPGMVGRGPAMQRIY